MNRRLSLLAIRVAAKSRLALASFMLLSSALVNAHELETDLLTVVLRDGNHLSMTFRVDELGLMHRMLSPRSSDAEFLLPLSAMDEETFAIVVKNFRKRFEREVQVRDATQRPVSLTVWHWPDIAESRKNVRQLTMQRLVGDIPHEHLPPAVISVDGLSRTEVTQLNVSLPSALDGLTVVHYRPSQRTWQSATRSSLDLQF